MNRRGFLKSIGKVIAGCAVVPSVVKGKSETVKKVERILAHGDKLTPWAIECINNPVHIFQPEDKSKPYMTSTEIKERWDEKMACFDKRGEDIIWSEAEYQRIIKALIEKGNLPKDYIT
ncbi:hypothetical protein LCGC14_0866510 [marine sediment metagenome]|uniref:Uncharacterized protein n=1 Tax=marine sediment metagenome TaxID=412755 RepID=A0A0F9PRI0_9ZZZZ